MAIVACRLAAGSPGGGHLLEDACEEGAERGQGAQDEDEPAFCVGPDAEAGDEVWWVDVRRGWSKEGVWLTCDVGLRGDEFQVDGLHDAGGGRSGR